MLPLCVSEGIAVIPWSPLARGLLTRPWRDEPSTARATGDNIGKEFYARTQAADRTVVERLCAIADERALPPARIALAWLLHKQAVTAPVVGATKPQQLEDAISALEVVLSAEEIAALEAPYVPHEVSGHS